MEDLARMLLLPLASSEDMLYDQDGFTKLGLLQNQSYAIMLRSKTLHTSSVADSEPAMGSQNSCLVSSHSSWRLTGTEVLLHRTDIAVSITKRVEDECHFLFDCNKLNTIRGDKIAESADVRIFHERLCDIAREIIIEKYIKPFVEYLKKLFQACQNVLYW